MHSGGQPSGNQAGIQIPQLSFHVSTTVTDLLMNFLRGLSIALRHLVFLWVGSDALGARKRRRSSISERICDPLYDLLIFFGAFLPRFIGSLLARLCSCLFFFDLDEPVLGVVKPTRPTLRRVFGRFTFRGLTSLSPSFLLLPRLSIVFGLQASRRQCAVLAWYHACDRRYSKWTSGYLQFQNCAFHVVCGCCVFFRALIAQHGTCVYQSGQHQARIQTPLVRPLLTAPHLKAAQVTYSARCSTSLRVSSRSDMCKSWQCVTSPRMFQLLKASSFAIHIVHSGGNRLLCNSSDISS